MPTWGCSPLALRLLSGMLSRRDNRRYSPCRGSAGLAGAWESQISCDILVLLLTIRRAYTHPRYAGELLWRMTTDGAVYFGIIIIANAANLVTFYVRAVPFSTSTLMKDRRNSFMINSWGISSSQDFCRGSSRVRSLSIMLLARLMLNLHEAAAVGITREELNTIELETLRFATVDDRA
ncbi:hypothetical protein DFH08DRAFT_822272 [Mycena albidolilacea]|uniref:Uncharacterized protein n=1 Tax=Mycena albidolilacea TaxID=1033008 RepID=A0AAD6Z870_9AGAR|nr:hypothetical protein DFH08DRAFT_822272 [Mycena albidolilacea]